VLEKGKANESGLVGAKRKALAEESERKEKLKTHINKINVHGSTCFPP
jgi:hypothetical protein